MSEETTNPNQEKFEQLLQENIRLTREIHQMSKRVNRYVTVQHILSFIYFLLITIPLIVGAIYLPIFIQKYIGPYTELLNENKKAMETIGDYNPSKIIDIVNQAQKTINNK